MTDHELMQQILDALDLLAKYENPSTKIQVRKPRDGGPIVTMYPHKVATDAAALLRERLAQPEQEQDRQIDQLIQERDHRDEIIDKLCDAVLGPDRYEWSSQYFFEDAVREVEERMAALEAQPEQEPVAWADMDVRGEDKGLSWTPGHFHKTPLYTTPPQRKPLTDEEIDKLPWEPHESNPMTFAEGLRYFARAIEAAHGIKEQR